MLDNGWIIHFVYLFGYISIVKWNVHFQVEGTMEILALHQFQFFLYVKRLNDSMIIFKNEIKYFIYCIIFLRGRVPASNAMSAAPQAEEVV